MMEEVFERSSWGIVLAELNNDVSSGDALLFVGILLVIGCLVAAAVAAWRAAWIPAGALLLVAIVAAFLLL